MWKISNLKVTGLDEVMSCDVHRDVASDVCGAIITSIMTSQHDVVCEESILQDIVDLWVMGIYGDLS